MISGPSGWLETIISGIRDNQGVLTRLYGVSRDVTKRKSIEDALRKSEQRYLELSIIDELTQLYNSRHFYVQLEKEIERSNRYEQPLTLLMLDPMEELKAFVHRVDQFMYQAKNNGRDMICPELYQQEQLKW